MQRLIIIRHAPTDANDKGVFMGHHDAPSSEEGLSKAMALGKTLNLDDKFRLYTSPLIRSKATLEAISPSGRKIVDGRLRERGLGKWEGCSTEIVKHKFPDAFGVNGSLDPIYTPPCGENVISFVSRVCEFLVEISINQDNSPAIVVTHNGVIAVMRSLIEERSLRDCSTEVEPFLKPRTYSYDSSKLLDFLPKLLATLKHDK